MYFYASYIYFVGVYEEIINLPEMIKAQVAYSTLSPYYFSSLVCGRPACLHAKLTLIFVATRQTAGIEGIKRCHNHVLVSVILLCAPKKSERSEYVRIMQ